MPQLAPFQQLLGGVGGEGLFPIQIQLSVQDVCVARAFGTADKHNQARLDRAFPGLR